MSTSELILKFESLPQSIQMQLLEEIEKLIKKYSLKGKSQKIRKKYDFSDLVGKLQWKGNALIAQKQLRNEWQ